MSQHDMSIANQGFPAFRSDLNDALQALVSQNSGATAPSTTFANMIWYDTANNILKMRNEDNDAWISIFTLNQTTDAITAVGSVTLADLLDTADIGTSVQAYDANLTSFVGAFALPTSDGTSGQVLTTDGAGNIGFSSVTANNVGFRNRIINGAMMIDQRNAGASVTPTNGQFITDRWRYASTQTSKFTAQQNAGSVTPPIGFINYLGFTSSSSYSVVSGDVFSIVQPIEGLNVADLGWGTADAQTVTLSFRVRSSLTGTFGGSLANASQARSYPFTYTISSANTWETKTVTIAGDTSGTWATDTSTGILLQISLGTGSTYSSSAGSWQAGNYWSATGAVSVVGTNGATFYITGVQLEKGSTATSFDYRPYGTELALCQRYYWQLAPVNSLSQFPSVSTGTALSATQGRFNFQYRTSMRAAPTITITSGTNQNISVQAGAVGVTLSSLTAVYAGTESSLVDTNLSASVTSGAALVAFIADANGVVRYSAEL
jgi:hypothetical protein